MRTTTRRTGLVGLAALGAVSLLAACASAPEEGPEDPAAGGDEAYPCMVSDFGGFDDRSFNELGLNGLEAAAEALGVEENHVQSNTADDFAPNIEGLLADGCSIIVTVGFALADATEAAATANEDVDFIIIDDNSIDLPNVKPLIYDTAGAAFLAGYAAAAVSQTGVVGTYGGQPYPTVTIFMDGFVNGVTHYNQENGTNVQALGWNSETQTGNTIGTFSEGPESRNAAQALIDQNADVIFPVGGPIYQSAAEAIRDSGRQIALIGNDADLYESDPDNGDLMLTSVLKNMALSVEESVTSAVEGDFESEAYVGTLENDGVGVAPFHDWEDKVPADLADELDTLRTAIISGDIDPGSPSSPSV